jgi:predicted nucleotide-binding protein
MARAPSPPAPKRSANLTLQQMTAGISRLQKRIEELEAFESATVSRRGAPEVYALQTSIDETLERVFGRDTVEYERYELAARLDNSPSLGGDTPLERVRQYLQDDKERGLALLRQAVRGLDEEVSAQRTKAIGSVKADLVTAQSRKIFVVHGHDNEAKVEIARFLERIGFEPIILHEQASRNQSVIEKIEANSDVGFAVVLLTPDDEGNKKGDPPQPRARQNVMELGYFLARLGRHRVCALMRAKVEIPSDFGGVVYETFDDFGGWKSKLAKELAAANYEIDWAKVHK